jgi:hypothetical protein
MQTTAITIVTDAYFTCGLLGEGEALNATRADFGLRSLNDMLDSWSIDRLYVQTINEVVTTIAAGQTFTVGPLGDVVTPLVPLQLERGSFFRLANNVDYEFTPITLEQYSSLMVKSAANSFPWYVHYSVDATIGTGFMYPALSGPAELHALVQAPLTAFPDLTTDVDLPQGYRDALVKSLAEILCLGKIAIPADLARKAATARGRIRNANGEVPVMRLPGAVVSNRIIGQIL